MLRREAWAAGCTCALAFGWVPAAPALAGGPSSADSTTVRPYTGSKYSNPPLEREQLRAIFFVRQTKWPDGTPVRVFVLPDRHAFHIRFTKEVLGVYPYQLRSTWDRMVYSGTGVPPTTVQGVDEMRSRVLATPGGIGYLEE